jgi:hypothetical protein
MEDPTMDVEDIETVGPWTAHIETMDKALAASDAGESIRAWRWAYSAALSDPSWLGLFTVGRAALRLRALPSLTRETIARARETCWIALFRARQQRSLNGALSAAAVFDILGDREAFEQSMRVVEALANRTGEADGPDRVRLFIERLADQTRVAEQAP